MVTHRRTKGRRERRREDGWRNLTGQQTRRINTCPPAVRPSCSSPPPLFLPFEEATLLQIINRSMISPFCGFGFGSRRQSQIQITIRSLRRRALSRLCDRRGGDREQQALNYSRGEIYNAAESRGINRKRAPLCDVELISIAVLSARSRSS